MRIATWNVQWARCSTDRGRRVAELLAGLQADVLVVTEGCRDLLPEHGHVMDAGNDWGYVTKPERRKVLAWSAEPWVDVVRLEAEAARGRVVRGQTSTPAGDITVTAVCIPWAGAHVTGGRRDVRRWDEHIECCHQISELPMLPRSILAGDFNQRIPQSSQRSRAAVALATTLRPWSVWTDGEVDGHQLIDHIATSPNLVGDHVRSWSGVDDIGRLSDHSGVSCVVRRAGSDACSAG